MKIYQSLLEKFPNSSAEGYSVKISTLGLLPSKLSVKVYLAPISKPSTINGFGLILKPKLNGIAIFLSLLKTLIEGGFIGPLEIKYG